MGITDIINMAIKLGLPDLAKDFVDGLGRMKEAAERSKDVLDSATMQELEDIHADTLASVDGLIASADAASKR